jgi:hypothetical protein
MYRSNRSSGTSLFLSLEKYCEINVVDYFLSIWNIFAYLIFFVRLNNIIIIKHERKKEKIKSKLLELF